MRLRHLLLGAMCLHLAATAGAYLAGRAAPHGAFGDGGIATFASDGRVYRLQINALERTLKDEGVAAWLGTPAPVHVRLYSLSFAAFSPLFGPTILSAAPLNLLYYLTTLLIIFAVGREAFGEREGLLAAGMCAAVLPSFLLHSTQLLKDPLFVVVALALVLVSVKWLTTDYTLAGGLRAGALGGAAGATLWLVKSSAWWVVLAVMFLGAALAVAQQARRRKVVGGNLAGIALMLAVALSVSQFVNPYWLPKEYWMPHRPATAAARQSTENDGGGAPVGSTSEAPATVAATDGRQPDARQTDGRQTEGRQAGAPPSDGLLSRAAGRIAHARAQFIELYPEARSNVDADVRFGGAADVARYLPRAALIGLCAPFPATWLGAGGQAGAAGRLLGGGETLAMYFVQLLALQSLWHRRRQLPAWLLALVALVGVVALGLVVVNVGALYRQRYLFWILFIVAGADALARMLPARFARRAAARAE